MTGLSADPTLSDAAADALVAAGLDRLFAAEHDLPRNINERTLASLYRDHLRDALPERLPPGESRWRVDFEYNRLGPGNDPKRLRRHAETLASLARELGWPEAELVGTATGRIVPDVVVHRRGSGRGVGNVLVCELKRVDAPKREVAVDLVKLAGYQDDLGYQHAYLILLGDTRETCRVHRASTAISQIVRDLDRLDEAAAVRRWKRGHEQAARRQRTLLAAEGARPAQAVAESLSALNALDAMGVWPGPRDPVSEQGIERVRRRWALVQHRAKQARAR
jgi:hypothetical protein